MPTFSKQLGFAPIMIILAVVILAAGAGGYLFLNKSGQAPSIPGVPALSLDPNCELKDPELCKFVNNWKVIKNYSVKSTSSSIADKTKNESLFELSGEDKFHMLSKTNGKDDLEMITIGDTTYTKDYSDNKWWKQKAEKQKDEIKTKFEFKIDEEKDKKPESKTTYKSLGKEACGKLTCFKYQVIEPEFAEMTQYIWFDDKEYLLRKERTEDKQFISESETSYDKVNISEPSPVKEIKPGESALPGLGNLSTEQEAAKKEAEKAAKEWQQTEPIQPDNSTPSDNSETMGL